MGDLPAWLIVLIVIIAILWLFSLGVSVWLLFASPERKTRIQYILVRAHFFKGFELDQVDGPISESDRIQRMATVKILRTVVAAIAFINFITALVLLLLGLWLLTLDTSVGNLIKVLVVFVAPLLLLLSLYSLTLLLLLHKTYNRLVKIEIEAGRLPA